MKQIYALALLLASLVACNPAPKKIIEESSGEWIQLFNGENLEGWIIKINKHPLGENFNQTFRVRDGMLVTCYDQYDRFDDEFGHIFYKTPFSDFKLRAEYRIVGEQVNGGPDWAWKNGGVMYHAQPPGEMLLNQDFPVCLEAQLLGGMDQEERPT
jgi:hypothetical protein